MAQKKSVINLPISVLDGTSWEGLDGPVSEGEIGPGRFLEEEEKISDADILRMSEGVAIAPPVSAPFSPKEIEGLYGPIGPELQDRPAMERDVPLTGELKKSLDDLSTFFIDKKTGKQVYEGPRPKKGFLPDNIFPTPRRTVVTDTGQSGNVRLSSHTVLMAPSKRTKTGFREVGKGHPLGEMRTVVIPTLIDGKQYSHGQALEIARKYGLEQFPSFKTIEKAEKWIQDNHDRVPDTDLSYIDLDSATRVKRAEPSVITGPRPRIDLLEEIRNLPPEERGLWQELEGSFMDGLTEGNPKAGSYAVYGIGLTLNSRRMADMGKEWIDQLGEDNPFATIFKPQVSSMSEVDSFKEFLDFTAFSIGAATSSMAVTLGGMAVGAGAGVGAGALGGAAVAGPAGAAVGAAAGLPVGAIVGAFSGSLLLNYGSLVQSLIEEQGVDPVVAARIALAPGMVMAAFDSFAATKIISPLAGEGRAEAIKYLANRTVKLVKRGGKIESLTEVAQQLIHETTGVFAHGFGFADVDIPMKERFWNLVDAAYMGFAGGTTIGGAAGVLSSPFVQIPRPEAQKQIGRDPTPQRKRIGVDTVSDPDKAPIITPRVHVTPDLAAQPTLGARWRGVTGLIAHVGEGSTLLSQEVKDKIFRLNVLGGKLLEGNISDSEQVAIREEIARIEQDPEIQGVMKRFNARPRRGKGGKFEPKMIPVDKVTGEPKPEPTKVKVARKERPKPAPKKKPSVETKVTSKQLEQDIKEYEEKKARSIELQKKAEAIDKDIKDRKKSKPPADSVADIEFKKGKSEGSGPISVAIFTKEGAKVEAKKVYGKAAKKKKKTTTKKKRIKNEGMAYIPVKEIKEMSDQAWKVLVDRLRIEGTRAKTIEDHTTNITNVSNLVLAVAAAGEQSSRLLPRSEWKDASSPTTVGGKINVKRRSRDAQKLLREAEKGLNRKLISEGKADIYVKEVQTARNNIVPLYRETVEQAIETFAGWSDLEGQGESKIAQAQTPTEKVIAGILAVVNTTPIFFDSETISEGRAGVYYPDTPGYIYINRLVGFDKMVEVALHEYIHSLHESHPRQYDRIFDIMWEEGAADIPKYAYSEVDPTLPEVFAREEQVAENISNFLGEGLQVYDPKSKKNVDTNHAVMLKNFIDPEDPITLEAPGRTFLRAILTGDVSQLDLIRGKFSFYEAAAVKQKRHFFTLASIEREIKDYGQKIQVVKVLHEIHDAAVPKGKLIQHKAATGKVSDIYLRPKPKKVLTRRVNEDGTVTISMSLVGGLEVLTPKAVKSIVKILEITRRRMQSGHVPFRMLTDILFMRSTNLVRKYGGEAGKQWADSVMRLATHIDRVVAGYVEDTKGYYNKLKAVSGRNSTEDVKRATKLMNQRISFEDLVSQVGKRRAEAIKELATRLAAIENTLLDVATKLGIKRRVRGKMVVQRRGGKPYPQIPNAEGKLNLAAAANMIGKNGEIGEIHPKVKQGIDEILFSNPNIDYNAMTPEQQQEAFNTVLNELAEAHKDWESSIANEGYFTRTRVELPESWVEWDPRKTLADHYQSSVRYLAAVREWGWLETVNERTGKVIKVVDLTFKRLHAIFREIGNAAGDRAFGEMVKNYHMYEFGVRGRVLGWSAQLAGKVSVYESLTKLGLSPLSVLRNMGQRVIETSMFPISVQLKAMILYPPFINQWFAAGRRLRLEAVKAGAVTSRSAIGENPLADLLITDTLLGRVSDVALGPFMMAERGNQVYAATVARFALERDIKRLLKISEQPRLRNLIEGALQLTVNEKGTLERRWGNLLEGHGETLINKVLSGERLTPVEMKTVLWSVAHNTQFALSMTNKRIWWPTHPWARVMAKFKPFIFEHTFFGWKYVVKEAAKANFAPLVKFTFFTLLMGELWNIFRDELRGKEEAFYRILLPKDWKRARPDKRNVRDVVMTLMGDFFDGGGIGILFDLNYGLMNTIGGPTFGTIMNLFHGVGDLVGSRDALITILDAMKKEIPFSKDLTATIRKFDDENSILVESQKWQGRAWHYKKKRDSLKKGKVGRVGDIVRDALSPTQYSVGENTLLYKYAAEEILVGDTETAEDHFVNIFDKYDRAATKELRREVLESNLAGVAASKRNRSPLGPVPAEKREDFLKPFAEKDQRRAAELQGIYNAKYDETYIKAFKKVIPKFKTFGDDRVNLKMKVYRAVKELSNVDTPRLKKVELHSYLKTLGVRQEDIGAWITADPKAITYKKIDPVDAKTKQMWKRITGRTDVRYITAIKTFKDLEE